MAIYRAFASNVQGFEEALKAKHDSGPLDSCFSTLTIQREGSHPYEVVQALEAEYPDHPAIKSSSRFFYFVDEHGQNIPGWPDPEYSDNMK